MILVMRLVRALAKTSFILEYCKSKSKFCNRDFLVPYAKIRIYLDIQSYLLCNNYGLVFKYTANYIAKVCVVY